MMSIFSILLCQILYSSNALILTKFRNVCQHYLKNERQVMLSHFLNGTTFHDPLDDFGLQKRIELCDDVLNAKQFLYKDTWLTAKRRPKDSAVRPVEWNLAPGIPANTLNYQRLISNQRGGEDSPVLQYSERCLRLSTYVYRTRKRLQCVRTQMTKWFVTHGWEDNVMYLLENYSERNRNRLAGILEPSAQLDQRGFEYFQNQFQEHQAEMESTTCALGAEDILRLCSAVFDTLSTEGILDGTSRLYYLKKEHRRCIMKDTEIDGTVFKSYFLRCGIMHGETNEKPLSLFYVLVDTSELGAAFVFFGKERKIIKLYAHLVQIRALTNPVGIQRPKIVTPDHQPDTEETVHVVNRAGTIPISYREREKLRMLKEKTHRADKRSSRKYSKSERATKKQKRAKHRRCTNLEEDERKTSQEEYQGLSDEMNSPQDESCSGQGRGEGSRNQDIQSKEKDFFEEALQSFEELITPTFFERKSNQNRRRGSKQRREKYVNIESSHWAEIDGNEEESERCSNRKMKKPPERNRSGDSGSTNRNKSQRSEGEATSHSSLMPERWGKRVKRSRHI